MHYLSALVARPLRISGAALPTLLGQPLELSRLAGIERLGAVYQYTLELHTPDSPLIPAHMAANVDFKALLGQVLSVGIELEGRGAWGPGMPGGSPAGLGSGWRWITGLVTAARFLRSEERRAVYEVRIEPWLHLAGLSSDFRAFQQRSIDEILSEVLQAYPYDHEFRLSTRPYPKLAWRVQYGETDLAFAERLMQEWGLYYFFEHEEGEHRLVIMDDSATHGPNPSAAYRRVNFYQPGFKIDEEHCVEFGNRQQLVPGHWASADFDFKHPLVRLKAEQRQPRSTAHARQALYHYPGDYVDPANGRRLAKVAMEREGAAGKRGFGHGPLHGMVAGHTFNLSGHPNEDANAEYLLVEVALDIQSHAQSSGGQLYRCDCRFETLPACDSFRSPLTHARPRAHGLDTAIVTGPPGHDLWCDGYGRVKVSFHWNRRCTHDENSSCWIRVAAPMAGGQLGRNAVPRIGQEVLIAYKNDDPDWPVIVGALHNATNMPPWELPSQTALSGTRSRELGGDRAGNSPAGRSNHLAFDDTAGQIQVQLHSDEAQTLHAQGYITRLVGNAGRREARGIGFVDETRGHGVLRAERGLLISSEPLRPAERITEMQAVLARLRAAREQHEQSGSLAVKHEAQEAGEQQAIAAALRQQHAHTSGEGHVFERGQVPELRTPQIVIAAPTDLITSAGQDSHQHSVRHHAVTAGGQVSVSSAASILLNAAHGLKALVFKGIRLIAARGSVRLQAQDDDIELLAQKVLHAVAKQGI